MNVNHLTVDTLITGHVKNEYFIIRNVSVKSISICTWMKNLQNPVALIFQTILYVLNYNNLLKVKIMKKIKIQCIFMSLKSSLNYN